MCETLVDKPQPKEKEAKASGEIIRNWSQEEECHDWKKKNYKN